MNHSILLFIWQHWFEPSEFHPVEDLRILCFLFLFFLSSEKGMHAKQATQPKMELQPQLEPEFGY